MDVSSSKMMLKGADMVEQSSLENEQSRQEPIYPVKVEPVEHSFTEHEVQLDWAAALTHHNQRQEET